MCQAFFDKRQCHLMNTGFRAPDMYCELIAGLNSASPANTISIETNLISLGGV